MEVELQKTKNSSVMQSVRGVGGAPANEKAGSIRGRVKPRAIGGCCGASPSGDRRRGRPAALYIFEMASGRGVGAIRTLGLAEVVDEAGIGGGRR